MNDQDTQSLLEQLQGVHLPAVSAVPAAGWWIVLFLLILLGVAGLFLKKRRRESYWRRQAQAELHVLRAQLQDKSVSQTLAGTSRLARKILLVVHDRETVASLHGKPWLEALDAVCARPLFVEGFGQLLETGPYQREPQVNPQDLDALLDAMDELIKAVARQSRLAN